MAGVVILCVNSSVFSIYSVCRSCHMFVNDFCVKFSCLANEQVFNGAYFEPLVQSQLLS
jgi:hypothetical protein